MSEPVNNQINIGGISFYQNDIKSANYNSETQINSVFLKDGTQITFRTNNNKQASIMMGNDMNGNYNEMVNNGKGIKFDNCEILDIKGTEKSNYYYINNSNVNQIDISGDPNNKDKIKFVYRDNSANPNNTKINIDTNDEIENLNLSKTGHISMNEGWWMRPSKQ